MPRRWKNGGERRGPPGHERQPPGVSVHIEACAGAGPVDGCRFSDRIALQRKKKRRVSSSEAGSDSAAARGGNCRLRLGHIIAVMDTIPNQSLTPP